MLFIISVDITISRIVKHLINLVELFSFLINLHRFYRNWKSALFKFLSLLINLSADSIFVFFVHDFGGSAEKRL